MEYSHEQLHALWTSQRTSEELLDAMRWAKRSGMVKRLRDRQRKWDGRTVRIRRWRCLYCSRASGMHAGFEMWS